MNSAPLSNSGQVNQPALSRDLGNKESLSSLLNSLKADMQELADDLMGGQQRAGRRVQTSASENKENVQKEQLEQLRQETQQLSQKGKTELEGDSQKGASFMASDEEMKLKKKKDDKEKALKTKKKLTQLFGIAASLEDVEFEDKEHQQMVDQFLKNMSQIRGMAKRLDQLEDLEEKYEDQIEKQNASEAKVAKKPIKALLQETKQQISGETKVGPLKVQNVSLKDLQNRQDMLK